MQIKSFHTYIHNFQAHMHSVGLACGVQDVAYAYKSRHEHAVKRWHLFLPHPVHTPAPTASAGG